ncbi:MAG TPA: hypothetical protein VHL78_02620, partial [Actinomycetota bacterium]|nr:hypothetical protein [Actinomycetota bacterium]
MRKHVVSILFVLALVGASVTGFLLWNLRPILGLDLVGGVSVILTAPEGTESDVLERTVETIRQRVDAVGVAEPDITRQGELNIQVQIPRFGGQSQERLLDLIGKTARLEYREVLQTYQPGTPDYERAVEDLTEGSPQNREVVFAGADGELPTGNQDADPQELAPLYRLGPVLLTGDALERAQAAYSDPAAAGDPSQAGWLVRFFLTGEGGERFAEITRDL